MKYFDTFTGIGGFTIPLDELGFECIGYSEIDKYASQIYNKHFPEHKNYGDITKITADTLPDFDIFVGGFPCQAFSIAGKRRGFEDTRGTLFFEIARILKAKQPRYFILENVKGLLSHDEGNTFKTIISTLDELGYFVEWQVLNSKNFGVPQNRERVFIIGYFGEEPRQKVFPITKNDKNIDKREQRRLGVQTAQCLNARMHKMGRDDNYIKVLGNIYPSGHEAGNVYDEKGLSPTIKCNGPRPNKKNICPKIVVKRVPLKFLDRNQKNIEGDYAFTVDSMNTGGVEVNSQIRRLTPLECERLQGFPDNWTKGISDTQRYKCCGNAVTVNVTRYIIKNLMEGTTNHNPNEDGR